MLEYFGAESVVALQRVAAAPGTIAEVIPETPAETEDGDEGLHRERIV